MYILVHKLVESKNARILSQKYEYPHHSGHLTYERTIKKWVKEERVPHTESLNVTSSFETPGMSTFDRARVRSLVWYLTHEKKLHDGTYRIDLLKPKTFEVV